MPEQKNDPISLTVEKIESFLLSKQPFEAAKLAAILCKTLPDVEDFYMLYGIALIGSGDYRSAEKVLRKALKKFPASWQLHELLGRAFVFLKNPDKAEQSYRGALQYGSSASRKDLATIRCALADVLWIQNKRNEALGEWRVALKIDPKNTEAKRCLAECTNVYGEPKAPNETFDDLYHFQGIHTKRYFALVNRVEFLSPDEVNHVMQIIQTGWNAYISPRMPAFDSLKPMEKSAFFKSVTLDFRDAVMKRRGTKR